MNVFYHTFPKEYPYPMLFNQNTQYTKNYMFIKIQIKGISPVTYMTKMTEPMRYIIFKNYLEVQNGKCS